MSEFVASQFKGRKILWVYPETPPSYWGFARSVCFLNAKSSSPPLPLITVAGLLPKDFEPRLVDMNIEKLTDESIAWADVIMLTGMNVHRDSMQKIIGRCNTLNSPVVVGGPYVSSTPNAQELNGATTKVIGEFEDNHLRITLIKAIRSGRLPTEIRATGKPSLIESAVPRYDLLKPGAYAAMSMQISRGCPHRCDFCDVTKLFGRRPRIKNAEQVIAELEAIYATGFCGNIFVVDDNFIGNPKKIIKILQEIVAWQEEHGYPFQFYTESDIRLGETTDMMTSLRAMMLKAGFFAVFVGIESPSTAALEACNKHQNLRRPLVESVRTLRQSGLMVWAGFIHGFKTDGPEIFDELYKFITEANIHLAMVGALSAPPGTELYKRLKKEGRLLDQVNWKQFGTSNFQLVGMTHLEQARGYRRLLAKLYSPQAFFARALNSLKEWVLGPKRKTSWPEVVYAVPRSLFVQGLRRPYAPHYRSFLRNVYRHDKRKLPRAFAMAIHFESLWHYTFEVVIPGLRETEQQLVQQALATPKKATPLPMV